MATLANGSFETGSFSSWSTLGTTQVRQGSVQLGGSGDANASFAPTDGSYFAQLTSQNQSVGSVESFFGLSSGYINDNFDTEKNNTYTVGSAIKQTITVSAGQKLSFDWKFKTTDYWSYNDSAFYVSVGSTVKLASVYSAGNYGAKSGTYTYDFSAAGDYTIGVAVFNESDSGVDSYLAVDNFKITGGVVNNAPSSANISRRINEDTAYTFAASDFSFTDPDTGDSLKAVLITSAPASGQLLYNGSTFSIGTSGFSILKADLGKLSFAPAANANGDAYASFQFKVVDQSDAASTAASVSFDVTPVNDAPSTASISRRINEDTAYTFAASDFSFTDPDSGDSLKAVLITSAPASGQLLYNGSTFSIGTSGFSILKADLGKLSFAPAANANGDAYASFQFKVVDQSDAASTAASVSFDVTPVNDAPSSASISRRINEDTAYTFAASDFSFSDPDSGDSLKAVLITSAPASGQLLYNGSTFSIGTSGFSILKADLGKLSFAPAANANGDAYDSFQFKVLDQSDAASTAASVSFDVTPVNDAPSSANISRRINEDTAYTFAASDFSFSDPDSGDSLKAVLITSAPASGQLLYNGSTFSIGTSGFSILKADLGKLSFAPAANANGDAYASFQFKVLDQSDTASTDASVSFDVTPVNDAPSSANISRRINEDTAYTFAASDFSFTDPDSGDSLKAVLITSAPASGQLLYNGSTFSIGTSGFSILKADLGKLSFAPAANANGDAYDSFQFKVLDQSDAASTAASVSFDVTPVNDAPVSLRVLSNLAAAAEAGVTPLGLPLASNASTGAAGALFAEIQDVEQDPLQVVAVRSIDEKGTPLTQAWFNVSNTNQTIQGAYGNLSLNANGSYQYEVNDKLSALSGLNDGQQLKDFFRIQVSDGKAEPIDQEVVITINGRDEVAKPTIDVVSTDDRINRAERKSGVTLSGSAPGSSSVSISWGSTSKQATVVNGRWTTAFTSTVDPNQPNPLLATSYEIPDDWNDGTIRVVAADATGQTSLTAERKVIVDTVSPYSPQLNPVTGDAQVNATEKANGVTLYGTSEANSTVTITWGTTSKTGTTNSAGRWSIALAPSEIPADESYSRVKLTATDVAGNTSLFSNELVKQIDTQPPVAVSIDPITADNIINLVELNQGITLTGTTERGAKVKLAWDQLVLNATVTGTGKWTQTISSGQLASLNKKAPLLITVTDSIGNSKTGDPIVPQFDLQAPTVPLVAPVGAILNGKQVVNAATKSGGLLVSGLAGSAEAGSTVSIILGRINASTQAATDGSWQIKMAESAIPRDTPAIELQVKATDAAGNQSAMSSQTLLIDTEAPKDPKLLAVTGDDFITGIEAKAGIKLQGSAEAGSTINLDWGGMKWSTITSASGNWTQAINATELAKISPNAQLNVAAKDQAGNVSGTTTRAVKLALVAANAPLFDKIAGDDRINQSEAKAGVSIAGKAEANSIIKLNLAGTSVTTTANSAGNWNALIKSTLLPQNDGTYQLSATATNASGLESSAESRSLLVDRSSPTLTSTNVANSQVQLIYSEDLDNHSLSAADFKVLEGATALAISQASISKSNARLVELSLNLAPAANSSLSISYSPSTSNSISSITDSSGNAALSFSKISPSSLESNQSVTLLADQYRDLKLIGTGLINGVGNSASNTLTGNQANNVLEGGGGADILTGLGGSDVFRYSKLTHSLLTGYDQITDFAIGIDQIDGPNSIGSQSILLAGQAADLTEAALQKILPTATFVANGAATFTYGSRTFLALNDSSAGFSSSRDAIMEITGYTGNLQSLSIN